MMRSKRPGQLVLVLLFLHGLPSAAWASGAEAQARATAALSDIELASANVHSKAQLRTVHQAPALLVSGELHLRTGQHELAILDLVKVVELAHRGQATAGTEADAHLLLGQAYFERDELHSARRHFETIVTRHTEPAFQRLAGRAGSRLVDVALGLDRRDLLPDVLSKIESLGSVAGDTSIDYARAKALLALGRYDDALGVADNLEGSGTDSMRAHYLRGVALLKVADPSGADASAAESGSSGISKESLDYGPAQHAFEAAALVPGGVDPEAGREISELATLAVARVLYERGKYPEAIRSYQKIPRTSKHFPKALFELSWTYVRSGDYERAQRTLEALTVLDPGLIDGADAALLRADLILRSGRFADAETAYSEVRAKYAPLEAQIEEFLSGHDDPAVYYDQLTVSDIEVIGLPTIALDWAREEARGERVFTILDDVARSRKLISEGRRMALLLRAALGSSAQAKVFPEARRELEYVTGLINQLAIARLTLARGMDDEAGLASAPLGEVRNKRRALMTRLGQIPTSPGDFSVRDGAIEKGFNKVTQALLRLDLEVEHLNALTNGLRRVLADADRYGLQGSPEALERYRAEVSEFELKVQQHNLAIAELRNQADLGRAQSGFGDERFVEDARVRGQFRQLFGEEVQLTLAGGDPKARGYAQTILATLRRIETLEAKLGQAEASLTGDIAQSAQELLEQVAAEGAAMESYAAELNALDEGARVLVGEVARHNFERVRERVMRVVMRADVGLVQKSWEVREKQMRRVRSLLRERAREDKFINDELREVLDDMGEGP
jgi:tetratricopeptide (TPR) repeat protein